MILYVYLLDLGYESDFASVHKHYAFGMIVCENLNKQRLVVNDNRSLIDNTVIAEYLSLSLVSP